VPSSEEEIQAARIGGAQPLPGGRVVLVEYDPRWPALYARETGRVRSVLGERVMGLEHCGSTSVPGLMAERARQQAAPDPSPGTGGYATWRGTDAGLR
jgi:hypothetical protein